MISSPAFINNEYLICQNLLYVNGNSSLPVYQEAEQVTDVRCQFVKVSFQIQLQPCTRISRFKVLDHQGVGPRLVSQHPPSASPSRSHHKVSNKIPTYSVITLVNISTSIIINLWH